MVLAKIHLKNQLEKQHTQY